MLGDTKTDQLPFSQRLFFAPFLAAVIFGGLGMALHAFYPLIDTGILLGVQSVLAVATFLLVMRFWKRGLPANPPATIWTRTCGAILVCAWWVGMAAWSIGIAIDEAQDRLGHYPTQIQATVAHWVPSIFMGAALAFGAAAVLSDLPRLRQTAKGVGRFTLFLAPAIAAYFSSAYPLRILIPEASPGLRACLQVVIAFAVFAVTVRVLAFVLRLSPEPTEKPMMPRGFLVLTARIVGVSFLISLFALVYTEVNVCSQPDHRTGAYIVPERLKNGSVHYMTVSQSTTERIATWILIGSVVAGMAFSYWQQRRAKKQTVPAVSPIVKS